MRILAIRKLLHKSKYRFKTGKLMKILQILELNKRLILQQTPSVIKKS